MNTEVRGKMLCMKSCYRWDLSRSAVENREPGERLVSPIIPIHYFDFQLDFYPSGVSRKHSKSMSIFLKLLNGRSKVTFHFSILNRYNEKCAIYERCEKFDPYTSISWGTPDFIQLSEFTNNNDLYWQGDVLRIWCEISFGIALRQMSTFDDNPSRKRPRLQISEPSMALSTSTTTTKCSNPFEKYFNNERRSDVKFMFFDGRCIHAHTMVLEHKSDVFADLFSNDVSVSSPGMVNIKDIDYEVLLEVMRFIYTDKVQNLDEFAEQLLEPANRYMLEDLKSLCEEHLCSKLSTVNVIDSLILAEDYNLSKLQNQAKKFVAENMKNIVHLPEFETVMSERPNIALDIVRCNTARQCSHNPVNAQYVAYKYLW